MSGKCPSRQLNFQAVDSSLYPTKIQKCKLPPKVSRLDIFFKSGKVVAYYYAKSKKLFHENSVY